MKKLFLITLVLFMTISLALAANGNIQVGQAINSEGQGEEVQLQVQMQAGSYQNEAGEQMQIQAQGGESQGMTLRVGGIETKTTMIMTQEQAQNKTQLKVQLSNGKNAEVKVMPDAASETAINRLQLKVCNSENNCSIELKEIGSGNQTRAAYEIKAEKQVKVLGLFKAQMQVQAQVDSENGEVIQTKKPWWSFLATN